jgi:hypothetical protein
LYAYFPPQVLSASCQIAAATENISQGKTRKSFDLSIDVAQLVGYFIEFHILLRHATFAE